MGVLGLHWILFKPLKGNELLRFITLREKVGLMKNVQFNAGVVVMKIDYR